MKRQSGKGGGTLETGKQFLNLVIKKGLIQKMTPERMLEGGEDATQSEVGGEGQQAARSMAAVFQEQLEREGG